jgi:hypothetical protein
MVIRIVTLHERPRVRSIVRAVREEAPNERANSDARRSKKEETRKKNVRGN